MENPSKKISVKNVPTYTLIFRPPGSANKKKKDEKNKKLSELEPDDFDNLPPGELLVKETDDVATVC